MGENDNAEGPWLPFGDRTYLTLGHRAQMGVDTEANRLSWERIARSILSMRRPRLTVKGAHSQKSVLGILLPSSMQDAFHLLGAGYDEQADALLDQVVQGAKEAVGAEDFRCLFPKGDSPLYREIERADGMRTCLLVLHHALWFRTGSRPMDVWHELMPWSRMYAELWSHGLLKEARLDSGKAQDLMRDYLWADDPAGASAVYRDDHGGKLASSLNVRRKVTHPLGVLYLLAEYAGGKQELEGMVRAGTDHWHHLSRDWTALDARLNWDLRLSWAYLRGRYFTGVTEPRALIHDLRGY